MSCAGFLHGGAPIISGSFPQVPALHKQRSQASQGKHPSICLTLANLPLRPQTDVTQMSTKGGQGARNAWKVAQHGTRQVVAALLFPKNQILAAKTLGGGALSFRESTSPCCLHVLPMLSPPYPRVTHRSVMQMNSFGRKVISQLPWRLRETLRL